MSPEVQQHVTVRLSSGEPMPAAVHAIDDRGITLVVFVAPSVPLDRLRNRPASVEWTTRRGFHRLGCTVDEGTRPGMLRVRIADAGDFVQRRDWFRIEAYAPVTIVTRETPPRTLETTTVDVSGGGIRITDPIGLAAGTEVEIALRIGPGDPVRAAGHVVRRTGTRQTAIRIGEISREDQRRLVRYVNERERAALRVVRDR